MDAAGLRRDGRARARRRAAGLESAPAIRSRRARRAPRRRDFRAALDREQRARFRRGARPRSQRNAATVVDARSAAALSRRGAGAAARASAPATCRARCNLPYRPAGRRAGGSLPPEKIRELFEEAGVDLSPPDRHHLRLRRDRGGACSSRSPRSARTTSPSMTAPGPSGARARTRRSRRARHEPRTRRNRRHLPGDDGAGRAICRRCPSTPRLALMKAEKIPLHFYRYLYGAVGGELALVRAAACSTTRRSPRKIHRDGRRDLRALRERLAGRLLRARFRAARATTNLVYFGLMPEWTGAQDRAVAARLRAIAKAFSRGASEIDGQHLHARSSGRPAALSAARLPAGAARGAAARRCRHMSPFPATLPPGWRPEVGTIRSRRLVCARDRGGLVEGNAFHENSILAAGGSRASVRVGLPRCA